MVGSSEDVRVVARQVRRDAERVRHVAARVGATRGVAWRSAAATRFREVVTDRVVALGRAVGVGPRAAGQFVARNPLCVVVPCHRVVASDGRLTGYAGGVDRKRQLLQLEGALTPVTTSAAAPATAEAAG